MKEGNLFIDLGKEGQVGDRPVVLENFSVMRGFLYSAKSCPERLYPSSYMHSYPHTRVCTQFTTTELIQTINMDLWQRKIAVRSEKHGRSIASKKKCLEVRLEWKGVLSERTWGHVEGPKTEKARESSVESLVQEIWRLRVSETGRAYRRVCKVEDIHRDKTEQSVWYIYSRVNSLWDWEPFQSLTQRSHMVGFTFNLIYSYHDFVNAYRGILTWPIFSLNTVLASQP